MARQLAVDLVAFDMGGTTVRDEGVVPYALRRALEPLGIRPSEQDVAAVRGASKREAIASLIRGAADAHRDTEPIVEAAYQQFVTALQATYAEGPVGETAGASEIFAWLHEHGAKVALTTGFDRRTRDIILRRLGWDDGCLDAAVSAEDVSAGRPAPYMLFRAMEETGVHRVQRLAAVGDTIVDLEAGTNAGAAFVIGVLGGAHDADTLGRVRHTHLIRTLDDLRLILECG
jgi:phosphonatase-like hydrolase